MTYFSFFDLRDRCEVQTNPIKWAKLVRPFRSQGSGYCWRWPCHRPTMASQSSGRESAPRWAEGHSTPAGSSTLAAWPSESFSCLLFAFPSSRALSSCESSWSSSRPASKSILAHQLPHSAKWSAWGPYADARCCFPSSGVAPYRPWNSGSRACCFSLLAYKWARQACCTSTASNCSLLDAHHGWKSA